MRRASLWLRVCVTLIASAAACSGGTEPAVTIRAEVGVSALVALTEARIEGLVNSMQVMATTEEVKTGDWEGMKATLTKFQEVSIPLTAWFALPDGSYYTVDAGLAAANIADRPYFPKVMAGEVTIGDLVVSKSTGRKAMVITVPVDSSGKVIGALGASVFLDGLSQRLVEDLALPDDMVFYAANDAGKIALHSNPDLVLEDVSALGAAPERVVSKASFLLGWTFSLGFAG